MGKRGNGEMGKREKTKEGDILSSFFFLPISPFALLPIPPFLLLRQ
jgi:hypothetical protein